MVLPPGAHYLLAFDDSRIVAGATRESGAGFDYRVTVWTTLLVPFTALCAMFLAVIAVPLATFLAVRTGPA